MRFFELSLALIAVFVAVNAAPATSNGASVNFSGEHSGRRSQLINKFQKRNKAKPCCGGAIDAEFEGRLDVEASGDGNASAPAPSTVNRNDRNGDNVNVVVNANHN